MAEPKTIALLAVAAVSALGAIKQGNDANAASKFDAEQLRLQGDRDRDIAIQESADFRDREARRQATLRARVAGSGATLEGSPLAVLSDLAAETEFQAKRIEASGDTAANRALNQGELRRLEGRNARQAGILRAGTTLLTAGAGRFGGFGSGPSGGVGATSGGFGGSNFV